jgi:hypothetical protein
VTSFITRAGYWPGTSYGPNVARGTGEGSAATAGVQGLKGQMAAVLFFAVNTFVRNGQTGFLLLSRMWATSLCTGKQADRQGGRVETADG